MITLRLIHVGGRMTETWLAWADPRAQFTSRCAREPPGPEVLGDAFNASGLSFKVRSERVEPVAGC
jgi:hypothetical protein